MPAAPARSHSLTRTDEHTPTIKRLHALTRGQIWDAGQYKTKDGDIVERYPDGRERVRFRTVPAPETPASMVEQNKDRYYETLERSSQAWHEGKHDPWPYINYVLFVFKAAYQEFAERVGEIKAPRGAKTDQVISAIEQLAGEFSIAQLEPALPGCQPRYGAQSAARAAGCGQGRMPGTRAGSQVAKERVITL